MIHTLFIYYLQFAFTKKAHCNNAMDFSLFKYNKNFDTGNCLLFTDQFS